LRQSLGQSARAGDVGAPDRPRGRDRRSLRIARGRAVPGRAPDLLGSARRWRALGSDPRRDSESSRRTETEEVVKAFERRTRRMAVALGVLYAVVASRYFYLQVVAKSRYAAKSEERRVKSDLLPARRGSIRDRTGRVLVEDQVTFDLILRPGYFLHGSAL